jgi:hypothetical protein
VTSLHCGSLRQGNARSGKFVTVRRFFSEAIRHQALRSVYEISGQ